MESFYYKHVLYDPYILNYAFADKRIIDPNKDEEPEIEKPNIHIDYDFLPCKQRAVFQLYLEGKNFREMGIILSISKEAARRLFQRGLVNVRIKYPEYCNARRFL